MKRLFELVNAETGKPLRHPEYFEDKLLAKSVRDTWNRKPGPRVVVTWGPEHRLFGVQAHQKTHSHHRGQDHGKGFRK